jgi:4-carboxymuconolactone decarboxylase
MTLKEILEASRGPLKGLYLQLLCHPQLLQKLSDLGGFLRFDGILPHETKKFIILSVAHKLSFQPVWDTHIIDANLPQDVISQIKSGQPFSTEPYQSLESIISASLEGRKIKGSCLEEQELQEAVILVGFYALLIRSSSTLCEALRGTEVSD